MADKIVFDPEIYQACQSDMTAVTSALSDAASILSGIQMNGEAYTKLRVSGRVNLKVSGQSFSYNSAPDSVSVLRNALQACKTNSANIASLMAKAMETLEQAEQKNVSLNASLAPGNASGNFADSQAAAEAGILQYLGYPSDQSKWTDDMRKKYRETVDGAKVQTDGNGNTSVILEDGSAILITPHGYIATYEPGDTSLQGGKTKIYGPGGSYYEHDGRGFQNTGINDEEKILKRKDIYSKQIGNKYEREASVGVEVGGSYSYSIHHGEASYENGDMSLNGQVNVSKFDVEASGGGGVFRTKITDENGKSHYATEIGLAGEVGVSYTLLNMSADGRVGNDYVAATGSVSADVGKVSAKVEGNIGYVDHKVVAKVGGSAEAIAAEVSATGGVDIVGIEATATGTVNFGIGGHANIGVDGGKIMVDVGASVGVGASVKFEVDVSEFVGNAYDTAKNVTKGVSKALSHLSKMVK